MRAFVTVLLLSWNVWSGRVDVRNAVCRLLVPRITIPDVLPSRYDARLLLESLPELPLKREISRPSSPGGWSDLPSDTEDTFFFSAEEVEDYRREKRRRVMDRDREARLQAIRAEEGSDEEKDPREDWGGSDEEVRRLSLFTPSIPSTLRL